MTTRVLLIRHADPHHDGRGRCYGTFDLELSRSGIRRASELARGLAGLELDTVVTSPRRRARETAEAIAVGRSTLVTIDERLRELDFGELEGRTYEEIESERPALFRQWMERPTQVRFPDGESFPDLCRRAAAAFSDLRERCAGRTAAVVTHGGVVRAILAEALGLPPDNVFRLDIGYCRISVVDLIDGAVVVRMVNGGGHDLPPRALATA